MKYLKLENFYDNLKSLEDLMKPGTQQIFWRNKAEVFL